VGTVTSFKIASIQYRLHDSRCSRNLARELARAFDARPRHASIFASFAGGAALKDMPGGTVGADRFVAAKRAWNFVAETLGGDAGLFI